MSLSISPFSLQLPSGYSLSADANAASSGSSTTTGSSTVDIVTIRNAVDQGSFTAASGDVYEVSKLVQASVPNTGQAIAGYRVALGAPTPGDAGGQLLLYGAAVPDGHGNLFTPQEFANLTYVTGQENSQQSLVVVAATGSLQADGTLLHETDSQAMQISANVTGSRSINAMNALTGTITGADADIVSIAQGAAIFTGLIGAARPTLQTVGNFTAVSGDTYEVSKLFKASAPNTGQAIAGYRVALSAPTPGDAGGQLLLNGDPVPDGHGDFFTAQEFANLTYAAGTDGSQQSLVAVGVTGTANADGTVTREVDSNPVQITANVAGSRSINAMNALTATDAGADADTVSIAQSAAIFSGLIGAARPTLQTDGNFTAVSGDLYEVNKLFQASAPNTGQKIAGYRVALGAPSPGDTGGQLLLNGNPVPDGHGNFFTTAEFANLLYATGEDGSQQSLVAVAVTGTPQADGTVSREVDSQAVQIVADVNGSRSINAMNALTGTITGADADIASIVQGAGIYSGLIGAARPTLQTDGNFTSVSGDIYQVNKLFKASAPNTGQAIAGYRVALGAPAPGDAGGQLLLNGEAVPDGHGNFFTAAEFAGLTYVAGEDGSQQNLVAVAVTGTPQSDGTVSREVDSQAVQITAGVTGSRSINAMNALTATNINGDSIAGADADIVSIAQGAGIFSGLVGSTRPTLQTDGNFTAVSGDIYRVDDLVKSNAPKTGPAIAGYRVALSAPAPADAGGQLLLNGDAVPDGHGDFFTAAEFANLTYVTGEDGSQQSLVAAAVTGAPQSNGTVIQEVDSQAVQITADVNGSRSINAMNALTATNINGDPITGADADIVNIAQGAGIFSGLAGSARPTLQTEMTPEPSLPLADLANATGTFTSAGQIATATQVDLQSLYPAATGSSVVAGIFGSVSESLATALLLLNAAATGSFQSTDYLAAQAQAIRAYSSTSDL